MRSRLRRGGVAIALLGASAAALTGCATADPAPRAVHRTDVPRPDLCKLVGRRNVAAALHGKVTGCAQAGNADGYTATFSGQAALSGRRFPATVAVGYLPRYDPRGGVDRWASLEQAYRNAAPMIGVGENALFDASATERPQLVAIAKDVMVSIEVKVTGAAAARRVRPEHLMDIGRDAVTALG